MLAPRTKRYASSLGLIPFLCEIFSGAVVCHHGDGSTAPKDQSMTTELTVHHSCKGCCQGPTLDGQRVETRVVYGYKSRKRESKEELNANQQLNAN